jgi:hypothetical protein
MPESRHRRRRGRRPPGGRGPGGVSLTVRPKKKRTNYLLLGGFIVIALLVIGSFGLTTIPFGRGASTGTGSSDKYVDGVGVQHPIMATADHKPAGQTVRYSTTPPTSGDHWAVWANCGFYPEGLPDERITHNLEHSAIVVSYNLTAQVEVAQLRKVIDGIDLSPIWGVTRFYDKIEPGTVAVAAWGVLDTMKGVDQERIKKFFDTYAGKIGPEKNQQGIGIPC